MCLHEGVESGSVVASAQFEDLLGSSSEVFIIDGGVWVKSHLPLEKGSQVALTNIVLLVFLHEDEFLLPLRSLVVPRVVLNGHLDVDNEMSDNDLKDNWGPPDATLFTEPEESGEHHHANDESGAQENLGILLELELGVEIELAHDSCS